MPILSKDCQWSMFKYKNMYVYIVWKAFGCKFCDWDKKTNKRKVKQKFRIVKVTPLMMMFVTHISYKYSSV